MPQTDAPYWLKIERAKRHIRELSEEIETFIACKPYAIISDQDPETGQHLCRIKINRSVPAEWSAILGDAIHNVRSGLDLPMVSVVKHCDPARSSYKHVYFPFGKGREEFQASARKKLQGASSKAKRLVESLKPYKGGDEALWRIHELDVMNKHKAIIPVGAAYQSFIFDAAAGLREAFPDQYASLPAFPIALRPKDRQFPLRDGAVLLAGMDPATSDLKFAFEIAFGEGQILDGEPIIPALKQMCQLVEDIFGKFEGEILNG